MEVKSGYKQTEVGVIPEEWEAFKLGDLIGYTKGFPFKSSEYQSTGIRVVRVSDTTYDSIKEEDPIFVSESSASRYAAWRLQEHDLVISTVGSKPPMYDSMVGKVILIDRSHENTLLNQNAVLIRDKKRRGYTQRLLLNHLRTKRYLLHIEAIYRGNANQASITLKELFQFKIPLPSDESEQRAIAKALSDVDGLLGGLDRLIAKKRDLKQAAMQQLLTGQTRLPGFHGEWEVKRLDSLADIRSGGTPSTAEPRFWDGDIPWCTPTDITALNGHKYLGETARMITQLGLKASSAEMIPAHSVVMTSRATIGECAINTVPVSTNQGFKNFVPFATTDVDFLYYLLGTQKPGFISLCGGSTFLEIGKTQLAAYKVQLPSTKTEQTAIAEVLTEMDAELAALEQRREKTRALKQAMMQELLTGRTRLVSPVAETKTEVQR